LFRIAFLKFSRSQGWCICELQGSLLRDSTSEVAKLRTSSKRRNILEAQIYRSDLEGNRTILKQRYILLSENKLEPKKRKQAFKIEGGIVSKFHFAKQPQNKINIT